MKKRFFALLLVFVLLFCAGCETAPVQSPESVDQLQESSKLVLYFPVGELGSADTSLTSAVRAYEALYPDVEVTVEEIPQEAYNERLSAELMAGEGPDIISAIWTTFPDLYKTMDTGAFLDVSGLMESDPDFHREDYIQPVMDAGKYKDGQYIIPVTYMVPVLLSEESVLRDFGLESLTGAEVNETFWQTVIHAYPAMKENQYFQAVVANLNKNHLLAFSGVSLYDRASDTMLPDEDGLRALTEEYKGLVYDCGNDEIVSMLSDGLMNGLKEREIAFANVGNIVSIDYFVMMAAAAKAVGTPVTLPMVGPDGKLHAFAQDMVMINANSKNTRNAWNFIKVLLSGEILDENSGMTVRKDSVRTYLNEWMRPLLDGMEGVYGKPISYTQEEIDAYLDLVQNPADCCLYENYVWDFYLEAMEPYFTGKDSYESCVETLRDKLTIYITE